MPLLPWLAPDQSGTQARTDRVKILTGHAPPPLTTPTPKNIFAVGVAKCMKMV